jgi:hypothetical protein
MNELTIVYDYPESDAAYYDEPCGVTVMREGVEVARISGNEARSIGQTLEARKSYAGVRPATLTIDDKPQRKEKGER